MLLYAIVSFHLLFTAPACQPDLSCHPERSEGSDTLKASVISSTASSLVTPQRITSRELGRVEGISEALRRFAGVQVRDYGGVGGLKTVNVRSLGSEHTGVFIDGIQVDNAQNMQVDLGRFGTGEFSGISLFAGQKTTLLQSAKEYSSANALYLESSKPAFEYSKRDNFRVALKAGSFSTLSPSLSWEHLFKGGISLRTSAEALGSDGRYRFHVRDYKTYPDGTMAGYDTTMTRMNGDIRSVRLEARLYGPDGNKTTWNLHAYAYDSERGLPGPVFKRAGEYPLSEDRQSDRDAFLQGRLTSRLSERWTLMGKAKYSFSHLEYVDFPELRPDLAGAIFNYLNHSAYASGVLSGKVWERTRVSLAQDVQYDHLDADLTAFSYPDRLSSWTSLTWMMEYGRLELSPTLLFLGVHDSFLVSGVRNSSFRKALMPSVVMKWNPTGTLAFDAMAKRSFRMPTFNDLYYTTVGTKTLDPEDAVQFNLGGEWTPAHGTGKTFRLRTDLYHNRLKNKIIAVPTSNQFRWSMYNLGKVNVLGADLIADYQYKSGKTEAGGSFRYTYQRATDRTDPESLGWNGQIPYVPVHSGSFNIFGDFSGWRMDLTFFASGERYTASANLPAYRIAPWSTLDAAFSKDIPLRSGVLGFKLCLNNILDRQYEVVDNYPMPGFNFLFKVEYRK